jgi:hypothetical protein
LDESWQNRPAARDIVQQIMALHERLAPFLGEDDTAVTENLLRLRGWAIWCLNQLEESCAQAIEYGQAQVADSERVLGATHPGHLTSRNNLAFACRAAGRVKEAIPLYERTLADSERVQHPDRLPQSRLRLPGGRAAGGG